MKKLALLAAALLAAQIAVYVTATYVYYALSDSCGFANDWYCSSTAAAHAGTLVQLGLTALLPPALIGVLVHKSRFSASWKYIIMLHAAVLAVAAGAVFTALIILAHPGGA